METKGKLTGSGRGGTNSVGLFGWRSDGISSMNAKEGPRSASNKASCCQFICNY